jgi:hypothetical protein
MIAKLIVLRGAASPSGRERHLPSGPARMRGQSGLGHRTGRDANGEFIMMLAPVLTPHGVLTLKLPDDVAPLDGQIGSRLMQAFARGPGHGLLWFGANEVSAVLPAVLSY